MAGPRPGSSGVLNDEGTVGVGEEPRAELVAKVWKVIEVAVSDGDVARESDLITVVE